jgi:hypothetical protein
MTIRRLLPLVLLAAAAVPAGCAPTRVDTTTHVATRPYEGPILPLPEFVAQVNARNENLPTLWARHYYEANIVDDRGEKHFVNGDGNLLYKRPRGMLLVGTKPALGRVFEIGSTEDVYWLKVSEQLDTMWWGRYENLGKPCVQKVPIDPSQVFEVLGVSTFNTDLTALPAPVLRYNDAQDCYMLVWVGRLADRYVAIKEVWYERKTLLPTMVILFDENGRPQLRASLSGHKAVEVADVPRERWPMVATKYRLFFPDTGTTMSFELTDMEPCHNGVPCRRGISFPGPQNAGVNKVIQLDQACDSQK